MAPDARSLKILHVLRAPLGGLFRHVLDLTRAQIERGHQVGLITDLSTGGERATATLNALAPDLALGLSRIPMRRNPHASDILALGHVMRRCRESAPDVVHGHGSKGGFLARAPRLIGDRSPAIRAYTPHGGSFNFQPGTLLHGLYMGAERLLARGTDVFLFESQYIADRFRQSVGPAPAPAFVVHNGIGPDEFVPVAAEPDAADFLYVGELRAAKGIDTLLNALALVSSRSGTAVRAVLVGSGPDGEALRQRAANLGIAQQVSFPGPLPARTAFALGHTMIVPSRAESLPYVVLEAAAARLPLIATNVGGIPEIFGPYSDRLIPCDSPERLADAMMQAQAATAAARHDAAEALGGHVQAHFSLDGMADHVLANYRAALAARGGSIAPPRPVSLSA